MIPASELILNADGTIYHLHLHPEQVAPDIITVGDPERVKEISRRFDRIDERVEAREFVTHTGELNGKRLTVISTGIGTDNVDIVLNEIDALFNVDLGKRTVKQTLTTLNFLRLGTSGSLQANLPLDSLLLSEAALALDGLLPYYRDAVVADAALSAHLSARDVTLPTVPIVVQPRYPAFITASSTGTIARGITLTAAGFYAPQGRSIRLPSRLTPALLAALRSYRRADGLRITNIEMETAGIYGLANALEHRAASLSALLANREAGTFSSRPGETVERLIETGLLLLTDR